MQTLNDHTVVVAGGTGNVGSFVVRALLERGATVAVPSRSEEKLEELREHLSWHVDDTEFGRLHTFVGNLSDETEAPGLRQRITDDVGRPDAALASLGAFVPAPSLLEADPDDLQRAIDGYLHSHFMVARTLLPILRESGGTYVFVQGPLAFEPWPESSADLVSIATAGQHMLFRALSQELDESPARVVELVNHAFIRNRQAQPSSPIPGEAVGAYAAYLLSGEAGAEIHGESVHLRSLDPLEEAGLSLNRSL